MGFRDWKSAVSASCSTFPGISSGTGRPRRYRIVGAMLYSIAPTILYLLGLPVPEDMPGKVLQEALTADFQSRNPIASVPSYEGLAPAEGERVARAASPAEGKGEVSPQAGAAEEEILEQLKSLGYVGGADSAGRPPASESGSRAAAPSAA